MAATKTLLIVEDNTITRLGLNGILRRQGYEVVLASNGEEALGLLRGLRIDLILLDMQMPVLDGWGFLKRFSVKGKSPVPTIIVTSSTCVTREWADGHGCSGFVRKPFDPETMLEEVQRCLR